VGASKREVIDTTARAELADVRERLTSSGADGELVALTLWCLSADAAQRPADGHAVAALVAAYRAGVEARLRRAETDRAEALVREAEQRKRRRTVQAAGGVIAVVLLAGLGVSLWQMSRAVNAEGQANQNAQQAREERDAKGLALAAEQQARRDETKARQQAFAALRSMTAEVVERKFAQGAVLTGEDRAFLRGVIAQFDAFAKIKGDDADSRAVRAEGRLRVGVMRDRLGELREAEQDYDQALRIYKQLAADFPSRPEFRANLAMSHINRGALLTHTGRLREAERDYDQALSIQKQLAADFPSQPEFRRDLARSHSNRANLLYATGRLREAEKDFDRALSIQKQLAADFRSRPDFRQDLGRSYNSRGSLLRDTGRLREAEKDFDRALSIQRQLAADFPSRPEFRHDLVRSHSIRGLLLYSTGRLQEAERDYEQALRIQNQLVADFPSRPEFREELANSHNSRGMLLYATGRPKEAEQDYDQALRIQRQLAADFPSRPEFRQQLANSHNNRGILQYTTGRPKEAEEDYGQALRIRKQLAADFPNKPDLRNELAAGCVNLALLRQQQGNWAAAKRLLLEGRPHHLAALKANPRNPTYRQFYRNHLMVLTAAHAGLLEQEDAVRTAETCRDLGWDAPADAYDAACFLSRCIPIMAKHYQPDAKQRQAAAQFYQGAAMKLLRDAVSKGYKDVAHMKKDTDLDPLRRQEDFQKLVARLEGRGK
jgi:tetratricopeptide (TPR) repeat protein